MSPFPLAHAVRHAVAVMEAGAEAALRWRTLGSLVACGGPAAEALSRSSDCAAWAPLDGGGPLGQRHP